MPFASSATNRYHNVGMNCCCSSSSSQISMIQGYWIHVFRLTILSKINHVKSILSSKMYKFFFWGNLNWIVILNVKLWYWYGFINKRLILNESDWKHKQIWNEIQRKNPSSFFRLLSSRCQHFCSTLKKVINNNHLF